ncbi:hypothetical protein LQ327_30385 [Actinomycetospora endophytica]|uniref:DUF4913 domain-containing protein n=1 Tax=Actinomycetospora endophytica TaxID=2291215 RepID=A0ABS8PHE8_9PSEU|nr:hypothetical protein [Actinomycetospora endophytica]MCD2197688.1 hypothetical protein [Actinomycetospora endophytica]
MTRRPPGAPSDDDGEFARADALAGLAREVDGLRRGLDPLAGVPTRVDDLARTVAQLADALAATPPRPGPTPAPSWLTASDDPDAARLLLEELCRWLHQVFLRYPDAAGVLSECWLYHPDAVEELLWLQHAWLAAYQAKGASVQLAGDWHDRQRPGVVRRLKAAGGSCSKERHQTRTGWGERPRGAVAVPGTDAVETIASWWATHRDEPAPEPAPDRDGDRVPGFGSRLNGDGASNTGRHR